MSSVFKRFSLILYLIFAFIPFWLGMPLASNAFVLLAFAASFAPSVAAFVVISTVEGRTGLSAWLRRFFPKQVKARGYLLAVILPILVCSAVVWGSWVLGSQPNILGGPALVLLVLVYFFAAGEELGWRGFMLTRLLERTPPLAAAIFMGIVHAVYHLSLWISPGITVPANLSLSFFVTSLGLGLLRTWLYLNSKGSVLVATLFHGTFNAAGNVLFGGFLPVHLSWQLPIGFGLAAVVVLAYDHQIRQSQAVSSL